jgi:hypothetical protein
MLSLSPGLLLLICGARLICCLDFALLQELHSIVVMPLTCTPLACCTRCLIAAGPGWPSLLCYSAAEAFCGPLLVCVVILCV